MTKKSIADVLEEMGTLPTYEGIPLNGPNVKGSFGDYPIHIAVVRGDMDAIQVLVSNGADINVRGEHGYSPLHEAIEQGREDVVRLLISLGANLHVKNGDGLSVIQFAEEVAEDKIIQMVKEH